VLCAPRACADRGRFSLGRGLVSENYTPLAAGDAKVRRLWQVEYKDLDNASQKRIQR
jgi:hypothetical protein